ncbi:MAG: hypothetical protein HYV28_08975 [Ignavibacteriales bacterium]|nr:hypothetical protein [Ignavibacteriales bacterium]
MFTYIDILGSLITGSTVMLMVMNINFQITTSQRENFYSSISQTEVINFARTVESDLYKAGYGVQTSTIFTRADTSGFQFNADYDNDTTQESIAYSLGTPSQLTDTENPNDRPIYRRIDNGSQELVGACKSFNLLYYDSLATLLTSSSLATQSGRDRIRMVQINLVYETPFPIEGNYQTSQWKKKISPRNLNSR